MRNARIFLIGAMLLLAACHGKSGQAPPAQVTPHTEAPVPVKRGLTPAESTRGMVEAVSLDGSTVPVAVKFELTARPVVGQPLEVLIAVMPQTAADAGTLLFSATEGLRVAPGESPLEIPSIEPDHVYRQSIHLTPLSEGVHALGLSVLLKDGEITKSRAFSVPVIVAPGAPPAAAGKP